VERSTGLFDPVTFFKTRTGVEITPLNNMVVTAILPTYAEKAFICLPGFPGYHLCFSGNGGAYLEAVEA